MPAVARRARYDSGYARVLTRLTIRAHSRLTAHAQARKAVSTVARVLLSRTTVRRTAPSATADNAESIAARTTALVSLIVLPTAPTATAIRLPAISTTAAACTHRRDSRTPPFPRRAVARRTRSRPQIRAARSPFVAATTIDRTVAARSPVPASAISFAARTAVRSAIRLPSAALQIHAAVGNVQAGAKNERTTP